MLFKNSKLPISQEKFRQIDNRNAHVISDIYDSSNYKKYRKAIKYSKFSYSFTINTDGVNLCDKSNLTLWPVYLVINEIDSEERFYIYNRIIAG